MRLIDKDALIKKLESNSWNIDEWELPFDHVTAGLTANAMDRKTVEEMPTVDAVPVIRCKDCKHWMTEDGTFPDFDGKEWHRCNKLRTFIDEDGDTPMTRGWHYCGMAERKEE